MSSQKPLVLFQIRKCNALVFAELADAISNWCREQGYDEPLIRQTTSGYFEVFTYVPQAELDQE